MLAAGRTAPRESSLRRLPPGPSRPRGRARRARRLSSGAFGQEPGRVPGTRGFRDRSQPSSLSERGRRGGSFRAAAVTRPRRGRRGHRAEKGGLPAWRSRDPANPANPARLRRPRPRPGLLRPEVSLLAPPPLSVAREISQTPPFFLWAANMVGGSFPFSAALVVQAASCTRFAPQPPTPGLGPTFQAARGRVARVGPRVWARVFCRGFGSLRHAGLRAQAPP